MAAGLGSGGGGTPGPDSVGTSQITNNSIVNADVNTAAAIAYSKLALTGGVVDADLAAAADVLLAVHGVTIDGGGAVIATGVKGFLQIPYNCVITSWSLISAEDGVPISGSIVIDIWKDTYANYPPTVADTITAAAKPTLSSAIKNTDATLSGWTTTITAGDILGFNVDSASSVTKVTLLLTVRKT